MSELSRKARGTLSNHVGVFRGIGATIDGLCDEVESLERENAALRAELETARSALFAEIDDARNGSDNALNYRMAKDRSKAR